MPDEIKGLLKFVIFIWIPLTLLIIFVHNLTSKPEIIRKELLESLNVQELDIFSNLEKSDLLDSATQDKLNEYDREMHVIRENMEKIWNTVEEGELLATSRYYSSGSSIDSKTYVKYLDEFLNSNMSEYVGKGKQIKELQEDGETVKENLRSFQLVVAQKHGADLLQTSNSKIWEQYLITKTKIDSLKVDYSWYYNTNWGKGIAVTVEVIFIMMKTIYIIVPIWLVIAPCSFFEILGY